jgi:hypothetical protein
MSACVYSFRNKQKNPELKDCSPLGCELHSVSEHSPGVVRDEEVVARFVTSDFFEESDGVNNNIFKDVFTRRRGASVTRLNDSNSDKIDQNGLMFAEYISKIKRQKVEYLGFIQTTCREIRGLCFRGNKIYCIIDTATPHNISHADIFARDIFAVSEPEQSAVREELLSFFSFEALRSKIADESSEDEVSD